MPEKIPKRIGLVPNPGKPRALELIPDVINSLERLGIDHVTDQQVQKKIRDLKTTFLPRAQIADIVDLIIVFGGDGTYLNTARSVAGKGIPILGVNLGRLGFLTEIEIHELNWALEQLSLGNYDIAERIMVQAEILRQGKRVHSAIGLNDVIITNTGLARMVELETYINEEFINSYPADGLIVATPTGSTAYSLSAGGPIVNPFSKSLIITPICPHTLYSRSIVISEDEVVRVSLRSDHQNCFLTVDGQQGWRLEESDEILIRKAKEVVKSVRMPGHTFYKILRDRMSGDRI
ncbi:NAD(+) kinase [Anoxybacter fermentans]|uniref:NAD kinase n=1 Tax=Anoxybacter fermentans TaxID=1323375 RepID=A0A3S9SYU0_9FIRM|nr:NAD(+)/NADH kinase [Anoxybacter fermentans]AZR73516.1 NAD(+) kinase [Anoxybacter fermentans]